MSDPSGETAGATYTGLSPAASGTAIGVAHVWPPSRDHVSINCSWLRPFRPSAQVMNSSFVPPEPDGRPFATSTLGAKPRSTRAPPRPSITGRPCTGSNTPVWTVVETIDGPVNCAPPLVDLYMIWTSTPLRRPTPNT